MAAHENAHLWQASRPRLRRCMSRRPELDAIAADYRRALRDLTFNSKVVINHLTEITQENVDAASVIVRVIQDHLLNVLAVAVSESGV